MSRLEIYKKFAKLFLVNHVIQVEAILFIRHHGSETHGSIFKVHKAKQSATKLNKYYRQLK